LLRKNVYAVVTVDNGADVLRDYNRHKPEFIVLDISIGEPSGIDVACRLRDSGCHSKIIFLTVHEDSEVVNAAMGSGEPAYVVQSRLRNDLFSRHQCCARQQALCFRMSALQTSLEWGLRLPAGMMFVCCGRPGSNRCLKLPGNAVKKLTYLRQQRHAISRIFHKSRPRSHC
jgi:DNA-binding NarL/FixJ family response regulator